MTGSPFIQALAEQVEADDLFDRNAAVVVGVSGGPDSMALLHALVGLNRQADYKLTLHVAHLNHQLRGADSDGDAAFVESAAKELGLPCTIERVDVGSLAEAENGSVEEIARRCRYDFLERVCLQPRTSGGGVGPVRTVAVGHHADDNAETILHRVVRGTGWRGLGGIPGRRALREPGTGHPIWLVRPLLRFTPGELLDYLREIGVPYRQDRTNVMNEPTRNRIRNVVMPLLESEVNPQVRDALLRLGEQARWVDDFLRETVDCTFGALTISQTDQELVLNAALLAAKPRVVQAELIRRAVRALGVGERHLGFANVVGVAKLLGDQSGTRQVHMPEGVTVVRAYDRLTFSRPTDEPREELAAQVAVHVPGITVLLRRRLEIDCRILTPDRRRIDDWRRGHPPHPPGEEWLDYETLHFPLIVRSRRPGDRFWPLGASGTRKLSDFLIDAKVSVSRRERVALLCDRLGPVYLIGYRIDDRVKLTSSTRKVLHLRITSLPGAK
ncbi:MAG: tRNA lysidine(34) synthetase TilS [Phycisphaerales bacterium]|nr:MAG: tRNA lysidine(34) synthetase TilS [Phycisphaerales bacterium]